MTDADARPIIFSAPMIRALLDGQKTQTRRIAKLNHAGRVAFGGRNWHCDDPRAVMACPYGQPGDLLWVREAWQYANWTDDGLPFIGYRASGVTMLREVFPESWTERLIEIWAELSKDDNFQIDHRAADRHWRPSIHMPRWASRLTLRITDVRVQRLQEISEDDARAEGAPLELRLLDSVRLGATASHTGGFERLWESIHGPDSWAANPWVWALTFDVIRKNVDKVVDDD